MAEQILQFKKTEYVKIYGPSNLEIREGKIEILHKILRNCENFLIPTNKTFPMKIYANTTILIRTNRAEPIEILEKDPIPEEWKEISEELVSYYNKYKSKIENNKRPFTCIVIGESQGKTTQILYYANIFRTKHIPTAIIDGDSGQQAISAPCTISKAILKEPIAYIDQLKPNIQKFVGSIRGSWKSEHISCKRIEELTNESLGERIQFIDPNGWVREEGLKIKKQMLLELDPDYCVIVGLNVNKELNDIVDICNEHNTPHYIIHSIQSHYLARTPEQRKIHREERYFRYFEKSTIHKLIKTKTRMMMEKFNEKFNRIIRIEYHLNMFELKPNLVIGVYAKSGKFLGIAILTREDKRFYYIEEIKYKEKPDFFVLGRSWRD